MITKDKWKHIEDSMNEACNEFVFPGATLLVQTDSEKIFHKSYGYLSSDKKEPIDLDPVYDIASITKPLCTVSILITMIAQKKIGLEDRLEKFYDKREIKEELGSASVKDLLSHSAGLKPYVPFFVAAFSKGKKYPGTKEAREFIFKSVRDEELNYKLNTRSDYSDLGFIILTEIIEKITSRRIDSLAYEQVFEKLGIKNTAFVPWRETTADKIFGGSQIVPTEKYPWLEGPAKGIVHDENSYVMGGVSGHAGLFSKATDMSIFVEEIFKALKGKSLLFSKELTESFFTVRRDVKDSTWALGWDTPSKDSTSGKYLSKNSIGHLGFTGCSIWMDLDKKISIILLSNRVNISRDNLKIKKLRPKVHDLIMEALGKE